MTRRLAATTAALLALSALYAKRGDTITGDPAAIKKLRQDCAA